jgi:hypothetical protein
MPELGVRTRQSFLALIGLAVRLILRRWPLYGAAVAVAFGVQIATMLVWHSPAAVDVSSSVALPLLTALVYARVWGDSNEEVGPQAVWERFLERAWAVIVIDFAITWLWTRAQLAGFSSSAPLQIAGIFAFAAVLFFIFADASATIDDDMTVFNVIPRAFLRSAMVTLNPAIYLRALVLVAFNLLLIYGQFAIYFALVRFGVAQTLFWTAVPLPTLATAPLAALTLLVYQDAKATVS